jgi:hypothetical protein
MCLYCIVIQMDCVRSQYSWQVSQSIWHVTDWPPILSGVGISKPCRQGGLRCFGSCRRHARAVKIDQGRTDGTIETRTQFVTLSILPRQAGLKHTILQRVQHTKYIVLHCNSHWLAGNGSCSGGASSA